MMRCRHEMILASAGSGKTYALTNRFVELLAHGARPDRIVALTFTRKAAGEFFDKILEKLAHAAGDATAAAKLANEIGKPELGRENFLVMLREVIDAMPRLRLGTLDGFFARVVRAFPLELGLAGDFEVMEEHAARAERQRVLRRMFAGRTGGPAPEQREFAEAFKRATFGREEKRLGAWLDAFLDEHHQIWLAAPELARWGNANLIWPDGCAWLAAGDALAAARELRAWLAGAAVAEKQRERWDNFIAAVAAWRPGEEIGRELNYVLEKALDAWADVGNGRAATLEFDRKKQELTSAASAALAVLVRRVVGGEIARRLEMTRGIAELLRGYEEVYNDAVRRAGKLGFDDVRRLLEPGEGAPVLSSAGGAEEARLAINYRLDGEVDHWLLDEFQDTSFAQWSVLRGLIDEAVQDPEQRRSFFYVGDVKQAIFGWRGGDAALFREIFTHYNNAAPGAITERRLVESWRSGPAVIAMVNAVFGNAAALGSLLPGAASARWNKDWDAHISAVPQHTGQAALLHGEDEMVRRQMVLEVIREIDPLARGLTCAMLVRDNARAAEIAEFLRENGMPALAESDLCVAADNPAGAALLALVQAAAHPGDTLAWEHVRMSPLGVVLVAEGIEFQEQLTRRVLGQIHAEGFERMADFWARRLEKKLEAADAFTRERLRQFAAAAGSFDATGSRDAGEFGEFMRGFTARDPAGAAVVRVMTVHKAKGLGFDVVVLPELEGKKLDEKRDGLAVRRGEDRSVEWVLQLPTKVFCESDAVLAEQVRAAEAEAGYENLSLLYVAMTRAKRAMYVLTKPPGKSVSRNFPRLLAATLGEDEEEIRVGGKLFPGAWATGEADWHGVLRRKDTAGEGTGAKGVEAVAGLARAPRRPARRPSAQHDGVLAAAALFSLESGGAAEFGTAVHRLFAEVEWVGAGEAERWAKVWSRGVPSEAEALACLRAADLAGVFEKRPCTEVWRERTFEIVLDGAWVTGVFDRVVVERDGAGRALRATVFDFKTDLIGENEAEVAAAVARYQGQLNLYRRVTAVLAGLEVGAVACELVLTRQRRRVTVPAEENG